jgi:hypothetical protein
VKSKKTMMTVTLSMALLLSLSACKPEVNNTPPVEPPSASSTASASASATTAPSESAAPSIAVGEPNPSAPGTALATLETLKVADFSSNGTYKRDAFGEAWADVDKNNCDTRNDILKRDIKGATVDSKCLVQKGAFNDPYTGKVINFDRSKGGGGGIDIDHIIPLSLAWKTGASEWDASKRLSFANDPLNLMASDSSENRKKGDKDASAYLPPNAGFHCEYVARQVTVRAKYGTWITPAEKKAIYTVLQTCPTQTLASADGSLPVNPTPVVPPVDTPAPPVETLAEPAAGGEDPKFTSCTKAKAAGFGPYTKADVEYTWYKDGDNDGTVCE